MSATNVCSDLGRRQLYEDSRRTQRGGLPISTAIFGCDSVAQVEECVELARSFTPLSETQMVELPEKIEPIVKQALFFRMMPR